MSRHTVSPGAALLRTSRMFSIPKPLPSASTSGMGSHKSDTATTRYPQHQSITSPLSSREKGDWGLKRPFPLKSTMTTSTPLIRIKELDTMENVTNFASAADHTLSLEKFQELRIAMAIPTNVDKKTTGSSLMSSRADVWPKSVFEEDMDSTNFKRGQGDDRRWKFQGPWLARMTEGEFAEYLEKKVRPKRARFRELLRHRLGREMSAAKNRAAAEEAKPAPPRVKVDDITDEQNTSYLHTLRNDRVTLYALVSEFLDLPPLGRPIGFMQSFWATKDANAAPESPYGKTGPPPSHPSAGISYLRTASFMENHPLYGPQANRTPAQARVVYPRVGATSARLGVGGFVANAPVGNSEFNIKNLGSKLTASRPSLNGIMYLDTTTFGGAKAYVEAQTASVDPSGSVVLKLKETTPEAQLIAKEGRGAATIYHGGSSVRYVPPEGDREGFEARQHVEERRLNRVMDEMLEESQPVREEKDIVGSSSSYGLNMPWDDQR